MTTESPQSHLNNQENALNQKSVALETKNIFNLTLEDEKRLIPELMRSLEKVYQSQGEIDELKNKSHEQSVKEQPIKMKVAEVGALSARADIFRVMSEYGVPEARYNEFADYIKTAYEKNPPEKVLPSETRGEKNEREYATQTISQLVTIIEDLKSQGATTHEILHDEKWNGNFMTALGELGNTISGQIEKNPNLILDIVLSSNSETTLELFANGGDLLQNDAISEYKLAYSVLPKFTHDSKEFREVEGVIESKLLKKKRSVVNNIPLAEAFSLAKEDRNILANHWDPEVVSFRKRVGNVFSEIILSKDISKNKEFLQMIDGTDISLRDILPNDLNHFNFSDKDMKNILSGEMPYWIRDRYASYFDDSKNYRYLYSPEETDDSFFIYRKLAKTSRDSMFGQEYFSDMLSSYGVEFHSLTPEAKLEAFRVLDADAIQHFFTADDLKEMLKDKYVYFEKIPQEFVSELRGSIIENFFQTRSFTQQELEALMNKLGISIKDFSESQRQECMQYASVVEKYQEEFSIDDFRSFFEKRDKYLPSDCVPHQYLLELGSQLEVYVYVHIQTIMNLGDLDYLKYLNKEAFENMISGGYYIRKSAIPEQFRDSLDSQLVSNALGILSENNIPSVMMLSDRDVRNKAVEKKRNDQLKRINSGFELLENRDAVSVAINEKAEQFMERYGQKGFRLVALAISAYGIENESRILAEIKKIEHVLENSYNENIPEGARVGIGIEYEVGSSIAKGYEKEFGSHYKTGIGIMNKVADIKYGLDGVHEIATTPTDNPYILLAEIKLLQDAGMMDFNFSRYPNASRGYHLSLGGESGIQATDPDMHFMYNTLTMSGNTGLLLGKEVEFVKSIHSKGLDRINGKVYAGNRVEFKGMACDSFEQFERAVISMYHAGIVLQLENKWLGSSLSDRSLMQLPETIDEFDTFLDIHSVAGSIKNGKERQMVFEWLTLKKKMIQAVELHNSSFIESEFYGTIITPESGYKELDLDQNYATKRIRYFGNDMVDTATEQEKYKITQDLFGEQQAAFVNTLTRANNLLVFKEATLNPNKIDQGTGRIKTEWMGNAPQLLTGMQGEGYVKDIPGTPYESIFDRDGEMRDGYYSIQGTSEYMITHRSQILLNKFNKRMREILSETAKVSNEPELVTN